jgi:hypothetical protein
VPPHNKKNMIIIDRESRDIQKEGVMTYLSYELRIRVVRVKDLLL